MPGPPAAPSAPSTDAVSPEARPRPHRVDIDLLRVIAAVMVVTMHVTSVFIAVPERAGTQGGTYWVALLANLASRCAVPAFFLISGWALMGRAQGTDEVSWLGRRLQRLVVPLVLWNIVYIGVAIVVAEAGGVRVGALPGWPGSWMLDRIEMMAVGKGNAASLWFLYYLVPVTLTFWAIRVAPLAVRERRVRSVFYMAIAAIVLPFGLIGAVDQALGWAAFGWALGYAILGYVLLSLEPPRLAFSAALYVGATIALVIAEQAVGYDRWEMAPSGPLVFVQTVGMVGMIRTVRVDQRWHRGLAHAASLTFGVYLVHLVFVQGFRITLGATTMPLLLVLLIAWAGTIGLSFLVVGFWHRSERLQRLLG